MRVIAHIATRTSERSIIISVISASDTCNYQSCTRLMLELYTASFAT
ncbi:MAG: hypothetical protein ACI35M_01185 [Alistipes sp.]